MNRIKITDAEMCIMKVLWSAGKSLTSKEMLARLPEKKWEITTLVTLAGKLIDKGAVQSVKIGRTHAHNYSALISEDDYKLSQTRSFIETIHNGSLKSLINTLFDDKSVSDAELAELRQILRERSEET